MLRDEHWFEGLYDRHQPAVGAYCVRRAGSVDGADAAAQVFSVAWRRRDDVPAGNRELPWLYGVARRVLGHHWRSVGRARRLAEKAGVLPIDAPPTPEVVAAANAERELVRAALAGLRPGDQEVLMLTAWEGLTHAEVAEALDCSPAAVDKRVSRAKSRLADAFQKLERTQSPPVSAPRGGGAA